MHSVSEPDRRALAACVVERAHSDQLEAPLETVEVLVDRYVGGMHRRELEQVAPEDLCGAVASLLELARSRRPDTPGVRLFNPTSEHDGWSAGHTVIEIVNDDMPFLVDSVTSYLNGAGLGVHQAVHPQIAAQRDEDGNLIGLRTPVAGDRGSRLESFMHIEIDRQPADNLGEIRSGIVAVLADVRASVVDWQAMRARVAELIAETASAAPAAVARETIEEELSFLAWINDNHFTFLGCRSFESVEKDGKVLVRPVAQSGLGIKRDGPTGVERPRASAVEAFREGGALLSISKSRHRSTVHRPVHMDLIAVKRFDAAGRVVGEERIHGLFTARAYSIAAHDIPVVRHKVATVRARAGLLPASHDAKALGAILENYPRDELFQISEDDLFRFAQRILRLQLNPQLALLVRFDERGRSASCLIYVPRDRHTTAHRLEMQAILEEAFGGRVTAFDTRVSDQPLAQVRFLVELDPRRRRPVDVAAVETQLAAVLLTWLDGLKDAMVERLGEEAGLAEWRRYRTAFPVVYQESSTVDDALADLPEIDRASRTGRPGMRLYRPADAEDGRFRARTFERGVPAALSTFLPMFENMGLVVLGEVPFVLRLDDAVDPVWIREFDLRAPDEVDLDVVGKRFLATFARLWSGEIENDAYNRLVLRAGLSWRQAVLLRAYGHFLRQAGIAFSQRYMAETLERHGEITAMLVDLFHVQLDPARQDDATPTRRRALVAEIRHRLEAVRRVDEDRILRGFLSLVTNTLRTNVFQSTPAGNPKPYLSLKFDAAEIRELPQPRPRYEIFVYSARFEAVHLRGGQVARGGIRWSDRPEDFRTEVLGLVKAQMVKNAVIVPVGAKGGFVLKRPPADRAALQVEGRECYEDMIRGLLDVTDNYAGTEVVAPESVVRRDGEDPYLVVAADKGTATFSDLANAVATKAGFWLGDAFASGGSAGYDHKKMGITARGAWESVKEHFRGRGIDVQQQPFTAVGVGDMSGDVFGNGMLISEHTRLVGAFNHLHIFVDPDPDPAVAYAERRRLFEARSGWDGYDLQALSAGGAVFQRSQKQIEVSDAVRERFGLDDTSTTPDALIRAMLCADIDLLWLGGIGTYVKAEGETNGMVGDRANDELRVDAHRLCAKVVGEGANLGLTQAARVAYALRGGRINTDFIDNSGGVDTSDHEVNIKIALSHEGAGDGVGGTGLAGDRRDALLESMTDEVAELVLQDNYQQARALSLEMARGGAKVHEHLQLIHELERSERLNRALEGLPEDTQLLERRDGLARPELAVLLAHAKLAVKSALLESDLPEADGLAGELVRYFPAPMRDLCAAGIAAHRLRREIVATRVANSLVNRVGPTFVHRLTVATGRSAADVARAYTIARDIFDMRALWRELESRDGLLEHEVLLGLGGDAVRLLEQTTRWFLTNGEHPLSIGGEIKTFREDVGVLASSLDEVVPRRLRAIMQRREKSLRKRKVPVRLARRISGLVLLPSACDIVRVARDTEVDIRQAARVYFALGERFLFDRLRAAARRHATGDAWSNAALTAASEDLYRDQSVLTRQVVTESPEARPRRAIEAWAADRPAAVERVDRLLAEMQGTSRVEVSMLTVAARELNRLVTSAR